MTPPPSPMQNDLPAPPARWQVRVDDRDGMRVLTVLTVAGVAVAIALAAVGGFPLDTPMPTHGFGWVAPSCGLTRGSTAIARGDFATAWQYNPAAFLVMGVGALGILRAIVGVVLGRWVNLRARPGRLTWAILALGFVVLWAYQQQHADFIINARI